MGFRLNASFVILAVGNPDRGDDALGPVFLERLTALSEQRPEWPEIEFITDFQLQIEHAVDLENRALALFVDASISGPAPWGFTRLQPIQDASYTSHALSPAAVLHVYRQINPTLPLPSAFQLAIRGESFELGEPLSPNAERHLAAAVDFADQLLAIPQTAYWQYQAQLCENQPIQTL